MLATHGQVAIEMINTGRLTPEGFLAQPAGAQGFNPMALAGEIGFPGLMAPLPGMGLGAGLPGGGAPSLAQPQLPGSGAGPAPPDIHRRMREEIGYLHGVPGAAIETMPGVDDSGVPDGTYNLKVDLPRNSGGRITLYVSCPAGYPQQPPLIEVELNVPKY
jgi:hypothetical protein